MLMTLIRGGFSQETLDPILLMDRLLLIASKVARRMMSCTLVVAMTLYLVVKVMILCMVTQGMIRYKVMQVMTH